ncbi:hypothetical protein L798_15359 [Zootermopsis nevadensis]|uniref:Uncharacterized protein n=1 Tax=Zootermopsis nevadensis TaxID=136037 RepID=A0A067QXN9_ZOONE|nr:hypothetical protein L798_15359 [Zootermopsis nevadensis]
MSSRTGISSCSAFMLCLFFGSLQCYLSLPLGYVYQWGHYVYYPAPYILLPPPINSYAECCCCYEYETEQVFQENLKASKEVSFSETTIQITSKANLPRKPKTKFTATLTTKSKPDASRSSTIGSLRKSTIRSTTKATTTTALVSEISHESTIKSEAELTTKSTTKAAETTTKTTESTTESTTGSTTKATEATTKTTESTTESTTGSTTKATEATTKSTIKYTTKETETTTETTEPVLDFTENNFTLTTDDGNEYVSERPTGASTESNVEDNHTLITAPEMESTTASYSLITSDLTTQFSVDVSTQYEEMTQSEDLEIPDVEPQ